MTCGQEDSRWRSAPEPQHGRLSSRKPLHPKPAACIQRPGREPCTDGLGSSEARAPAHRVWSPNLMLQRKQVHGVCTGARPRCTTPPRAEEAHRPGGQEPPSQAHLPREPGHRWHAASRRQPGHQMLHAPFFLGEPDEPSCPWWGCCPSRVCAGTAGWGLLSPAPPIPPQARLLLASEAGSQGLGTHPGCACRCQNLGRGLPAGFSRSQL